MPKKYGQGNRFIFESATIFRGRLFFKLSFEFFKFSTVVGVLYQGSAAPDAAPGAALRGP